MPPRITRVKWSALDVPFGVKFDEATGTFSGIPEDAGNYIVPVKVTTNYGSDMKDVEFNAIATYNMYAIGQRASLTAWSNHAEPDEYGFRPVNISNVIALNSRIGGFSALRYDNGKIQTSFYGLNTLENNVPAIYANVFKQTTAITHSSGTDKFHEQLQPFLLQRMSGQLYFYWGVLVKYNSADNTITLSNSSCLRHNSGSSGNDITIGVTTPDLSKLGIEKSLDIGRVHKIVNNTFYYENNYVQYVVNFLSNDGQYVRSIIYVLNSEATSSNQSVAQINGKVIWDNVNQAIGYRAIKLLRGCPFRYLSEDMYLDNDPSNFTHGTIKNVWCGGEGLYVQTITDNLYRYNEDGSWRNLGNYPIKKLEIGTSNLFLLTTDGRLYHKGVAISDVTDEHEGITQIFPALKFVDFTFSGDDSDARGGNTLVVLRED